ncbi:aminotransferase [Syncephalis fuscata]|nr:aminotransferase [Syncephalis fuscata]
MKEYNFSLLETMLYEPEHGILLLDQHLQRLYDSIDYFNNETIKEQANAQTARIRLLWSRDGHVSIEVSPFTATQHNDDDNDAPLPIVVLDSQPINTQDTSFLSHKTTNRDIYNEARQRHGVNPNDQNSPFDVILWNNSGDITETTIANIAVEDLLPDGQIRWLTPTAIHQDLLPGTFRAELLARGELTEARISKHDFIQAVKQGRRIHCFNSVRKRYPVQVILDN